MEMQEERKRISFQESVKTAFKEQKEVPAKKDLLTETSRDAYNTIPNFIKGDGFTCVERETITFAKPICQIVDSKDLTSGVTYYKCKEGFFKESHPLNYASSTVEPVSAREALQIFNQCLTTSNTGAGKQYYASSSFKEEAEVMKNSIKIAEFIGAKWKVEFYASGASYKEVYSGINKHNYFVGAVKDVSSNEIEARMRYYTDCLIQENKAREVQRLTSNNFSKNFYTYAIRKTNQSETAKVVHFWKLNREERYFRTEYEYDFKTNACPLLSSSEKSKREVIEEIANFVVGLNNNNMGYYNDGYFKKINDSYEEVMEEPFHVTCAKFNIGKNSNRLTVGQFDEFRQDLQTAQEESAESEKPEPRKYGSFSALLSDQKKSSQERPSLPTEEKPVFQTREPSVSANGKPQFPSFQSPKQTTQAGRSMNQFDSRSRQSGQDSGYRSYQKDQNEPVKKVILKDIQEICLEYGIQGEIKQIKDNEYRLMLYFCQGQKLDDPIYISVPSPDSYGISIWYQTPSDSPGQHKNHFASDQSFFNKYNNTVQKCFSQVLNKYSFHQPKGKNRGPKYRSVDYGDV